MGRRIPNWLKYFINSATVFAAAIASASLMFAASARSSESDHQEGKSTASRIRRIDDHRPEEWRSTGRTLDEQRFSPLSVVNQSNVGRLGLAWYYDIPSDFGQEATPLVVGGIMYVATDWSVVRALDARSGKLLWSYDPKIRQSLVKTCCSAVNRGVAVYRDNVFVGTLDGRLIALNAQTGKLVWSQITVDQTKPYNITGAPRMVKDLVIIGNGGAEMGVRGYVSAYVAQTGKLAWRFFTVPGEPGNPDGAVSDRALAEKAQPTWTGEWWKYGGGGTVWDSMAYDAESDTLYIGVGNGTPWNPALRSPGGGDNLFLASIIALRGTTGDYIWHYQVTPAEAWDFDATQNLVLATLALDGARRPVLMQASKNGFFYVLDRRTGKLISAKPFVPVTWASGIDAATGRPVEMPGARYYKTGKPFLLAPSGYGAHNWPPMSYSPSTQLVYLPVQQLAVQYMNDNEFAYGPKKQNLGVSYALGDVPDQFRTGAWLIAWNPTKQREAWRITLPGVWSAGVLSTAGGLVFQGNTAGQFVAYAANTGNPLWSAEAAAGIIAAPMSFSLDGEQYVAVMAGWGGSPAMIGGSVGGKLGQNRVLAYKLDSQKILPSAKNESPDSAVLTHLAAGSPAAVAMGDRLYNTYCSRCHGFNAVSGGVVPDLRRSFALQTEDLWLTVVRDGILKENGMTSFGDVMTEEQIKSIRSFVINAVSPATD